MRELLTQRQVPELWRRVGRTPPEAGRETGPISGFNGAHVQAGGVCKCCLTGRSARSPKCCNALRAHASRSPVNSNVRPHEHSDNSFSLGSHRVFAFEHRLGRCSLVRIAPGWLSSHPEILDGNNLRRRRWRRLHSLRIPALGYRRGLGGSSESECSAFRLLHSSINLSSASGFHSHTLSCVPWRHPIRRCPVVWQRAGVWAGAHACGLTLYRDFRSSQRFCFFTHCQVELSFSSERDARPKAKPRQRTDCHSTDGLVAPSA